LYWQDQPDINAHFKK